MKMTRRARRGALVVHVSASAAWLGVSVCLLALGITGAVPGTAAASEASYRAMKVFGDWLIGPLALATTVTGLLLSLGTRWGLARYHWVWIKFWLTLAAGTASVLVFRTTVNETVADVVAGHPVTPSRMIVPPAVSLSAYVFMTAISVLKPWGPTRRGRRERQRRLREQRSPGERPGGPGSTPRTAPGRRSGAPAPPGAHGAYPPGRDHRILSGRPRPGPRRLRRPARDRRRPPRDRRDARRRPAGRAP